MSTLPQNCKVFEGDYYTPLSKYEKLQAEAKRYKEALEDIIDENSLASKGIAKRALGVEV
ncbi:hypothetical protein [Bacillus solitudinis]|uniref:hypothetical protein n=1 Tax=Bacillus solitudinis TaxID=2014074 RepID=UPI000C24A72B|nr:hypothetical protein [Bacillus solitudinis]